MRGLGGYVWKIGFDAVIVDFSSHCVRFLVVRAVFVWLDRSLWTPCGFLLFAFLFFGMWSWLTCVDVLALIL